jgi:hypothetical protein
LYVDWLPTLVIHAVEYLRPVSLASESAFARTVGEVSGLGNQISSYQINNEEMS